MAKPAKKAIAKSNIVDNVISSSIASLEDAMSNADKAIATRSKEAKSFAAESKRLSKKRAGLLKRKKIASAKVKKLADAASRKSLKDVEKEIVVVKKALEKVKPAKDSNSAELVSLKASYKRVSAYMKGVTSADKVLNKPAKKRKKSKAKKAA